ncbi:uncharacterized protein LOC131944111 [Physella acuta]|uniref:uncharacterized protein LOC131944111 n=1 Tax=Physella acuta TaxID=109671 RepID=UPI0027DDD144|nr:uncharacterized protein LOC131944111 [Physella acuta]
MASRDRQSTSADLLLNSGANSNQFSIDGLNTSMSASNNGHETLVELLINSGADFKRVDEYGRDALMLASSGGHKKVVELLINSGVDFKRVDKYGWDALMLASINGHEKVVELLINSGADFKRVDKYGWDALMRASINGHEKVVELLINSGADFKRVDKNGRDALMLASRDGHDKVVELLINSGADFKGVDKNGRDALMLASSDGHEKVVELLINGGADINHVTNRGSDALMFASNKGREKVVELLINSGADFKRVDTDGCDALMLASSDGHEKVVELLINSGADFKRVDKYGWDALMRASSNGHEKVVELLINSGADFKRVDEDGRDALMLASNGGHEKVVELLISSGADFKRVDKYGWDALMIASLFEHDKVVELLINGGADIKRVEPDGQDALMIASLIGHDKVVELLINGGADINHVNNRGSDALMLASSDGHEKVVELLINSGADFKRVDEDGRDALMLALKKGHDNIIQLLLKEVLLMQEKEKSSDLSPIPFNRNNIMAIYLLDILFQAFENKLYSTMEQISIFVDENCSELNFKFQLKRFCELILQALNQDVQNDTKTQPSDSTISELYNIEFKNFKKSIDCYVKIVVLTHNEQTPNSAELLEFVSDVMSEFSSMEKFNPFFWFVCQRTLHTIVNRLQLSDRRNFYTVLIKHSYADLTICYLEKENLLDISSPGFMPSLIRDMLTLLWDGCHHSLDFALTLAKNNIVKILTDFLYLHKDAQNMHSKFIIRYVIPILQNISRRPGVKGYFTSSKTHDAVINMEFDDLTISISSKLLLLHTENESTAETEKIKNLKRSLKESIMLAVSGDVEDTFGFSLTEMLHGLSKFTERDEELNEILPLVPNLKEILKHDDVDEHIFTTKCLKELSRNKEASHQIINDETFNDTLTKLMSSENEIILENVHSIRWRSGRTTGTLPTKTDCVFSDEFPRRFDIDPAPLAQGSFGSVHLVIDRDEPDEKKFVAKKTIKGPLVIKKWMLSFGEVICPSSCKKHYFLSKVYAK